MGRQSSPGEGLDLSADRITVGRRSLRLAEITGIRYGIVETRVMGVVATDQEYTIGLTNGRDTIEIKRHHWFNRGQAEVGFQEMLEALFKPVVQPLLNRLLATIASGNGFDLKDPSGVTADVVHVDKRGLLLKRGKFLGVFGPGERLLPWRDFHGHAMQNGRLLLAERDQASDEPKVFVALSLKDTWNAVCVPPLIDHAYETGVLPGSAT